MKGRGQDDATKTVQDAYIRSLEDQIAFLRQQLERRDAILLNLTERIPELEAPREGPGTRPDAPSGARGSPETATEGPGEAWGTSQREAAERPFTEEEPRRRSWWREFFGVGE